MIYIIRCIQTGATVYKGTGSQCRVMLATLDKTNAVYKIQAA